ncbi:MAG: hypothetical protein C0591_10040 [Marinilabiliales bacterium]|nr:MAG: hypothetical protein C0591_10040 [Marinilabiliales bacterium]
MKKKIFNERTAILLVILISFLYTSNLFAQNTSETPLISATLYKGVDEVEKVLNEGVDINQQDSRGYTALIWACSYSSREAYRETAKLLISEGTDVNIQSNDGNAAIIEAAGNSREIFNLLLDKGADLKVKKEDGTGAYYNCMVHMLLYGREITEKDLELAELLLTYGAHVDEAPISGELQGFTPLIFAARENNIEVVNFLIEHGADVNAKNVYGDTPLSVAENGKNIKIVEILTANGAK